MNRLFPVFRNNVSSLQKGRIKVKLIREDIWGCFEQLPKSFCTGGCLDQGLGASKVVVFQFDD